MGSSVARIIAPLLLVMLGAAAMFAAINGLYANLVLALLLSGWIAAAMVVDDRRARRPVASPPAMPPTIAEQARSQRRLTAYLNLSPAPLVTLDGDKRLHAVNRAARRLFGCDDRIPAPPAALIDAIEAALPGRSASVRLDIGGTARSFALASADLSGDGAGLRIAALVDIESELRAAEASALRDLLQVLSHEIMNALTPIASLGRTAADMLADHHEAAIEPARDAVETVARRAEGLQRFTTAYRDLARLPAPTLARTSLADLIDDLARLAAVRWPDLALSVAVDHVPRTVLADADQLHAALWALVQNAAEATRGAGTVTITGATTPGGVAITVIDDGPGIPPGQQEAIFAPFFTTKAEGSGVGLALVRQIAHAHQGDVAVESSPGRTMFLIELPRTI
jgi:two-component system nitrogen regulation sensor histidine kinase NtrY